MTRVLQTFIKHKLNRPHSSISFGPLNSSIQLRWKKKPSSTARTRLETRTRDLKLDQLSAHFKKLNLILHLHKLMTDKKRGPFVSLQLMSRWNDIIGLNIGIGAFLRKYPHVFDVFTHPVKRNVCCRITDKMMGLLNEEENVVKGLELENVKRFKKILLMSVNGKIHVHALRLVRRELGLPEDFRDSILGKYCEDLRLVDMEIVALVDRGDESLRVAKIEEWREKEYREKWWSEFETKYAFPIDFPTGFKIGVGFKEKLKNWQRMNYVKPYDDVNEVVRARTCGGIERFEKRAVAVLHELLSLTVEKMIEVDRIVHFRKDLGIEVNIRELILKHPGIFYISTKGSNQLVFLREAYSRGCLVETNQIYDVRRKMLELMLMGCRNTKELKIEREEMKDKTENQAVYYDRESGRDTDFVISILEKCHGHDYDYGASHIEELSE